MSGADLLKERGITPATQKAFGVWFDTDTWTFPYPAGFKYRKCLPDDKRKFRYEGTLGLYGIHENPYANSVAIICEGETDTMRMWQEYGDTRNVYGVPGAQSWQPHWEVEGKEVFVVLDNGEHDRKEVDNGWKRIRKSYPNAHRVHLPDGCKDVCEYFLSHTKDEFLTLLEEAKIPKYHYDALDLTVSPPPVDWLVEGMIAKGDLVVLMGEPNVGKSLLMQDLEVKIAEGMTDWLGRELFPHTNKVMVLDEENPMDVVYNRLHQLGMSDFGTQNIRYLLNQGIKLDRNPEKILEEALLFRPDLIVVDSLTRMHSKNENSAGEINALFNEALKPLARETNAAVVFLHHAGKSESNNSFNKSRGSSDIIAAPDGGFELRATSDVPGEEILNLINFKTRRGSRSRPIPLTIRSINDKIRVKVFDDTDIKDGDPF